jgi:hypothetical protein
MSRPRDVGGRQAHSAWALTTLEPVSAHCRQTNLPFRGTQQHTRAGGVQPTALELAGCGDRPVDLAAEGQGPGSGVWADSVRLTPEGTGPGPIL